MTGSQEAPKRNHASASRTVKCSAGQAKQRMQVFVDYCKRKDAPSEVARWRWRVRSSSQSSCRAARAESGDEVQAVRERACNPADAGVPSPTQNPTCPSGVPRLTDPRRLAVQRRRSMGHLLGSLRRQRTHAVIGAHVLADRLQTLQDTLPLRPIELPQVWAKTLNEGIFQHRLAIGLGHEEAVQSNTQSFGNLFQRAEARRHLTALDPGQIGARYARTSLQLALRHAARLAQLPDALADVLHSFAVRPALKQLTVVPRKILRRRRRNDERHLRGQHTQTTTAVVRACPVLH